jgi:hypothetical protein
MWNREIKVGINHQAKIPECLCNYDDALPYENEDTLLWDPTSLPEKDVEDYLVKARGLRAIPTGAHTRDDEQDLYLLHQCGYNIEEALRRRHMNVVLPADTMSLWSEEERRNFEKGLLYYHKDFHLIQRKNVRTRSVSELVNYYYLWKKTKWHDIFVSKARLRKKKYALHPGITNYTDRFLDALEPGTVTHRNRRSSQKKNVTEGQKQVVNHPSRFCA